MRRGDTCRTCLAWSTRDFMRGECRMRPPVSVQGGREWPVTAHDDWCAAHEEGVKPTAEQMTGR